MAILFSTSSDEYQRSASLPSPTNISWCGWAYRAGNNDGSNNRFIFDVHSSGFANEQSVYFNDSDEDILYYGDGAEVTILASSAINTWYFLAFSCSGSGAGAVSLYYRTASSATLTSTTTAGTTFTPALMAFGNTESLGYLNGRAAAFKVWDAVLTIDEFLVESHFYRAVRRANLNVECPLIALADDEIDYSGNGRNLTVVGTPSAADGPPILWAPRGRRIKGAIASSTNRLPLLTLMQRQFAA